MKKTPELSIADYLLWAIQRYLLQKEARFYKALESKYSLILDLHDPKIERSTYYDKNNQLDIEKVSEFRTDGCA